VRFRVGEDTNVAFKLVKQRGLLRSAVHQIPIKLEEATQERGQTHSIVKQTLTRGLKNEYTQSYTFSGKNGKPFLKFDLRFHIGRADGVLSPRS